MNPNPIKNRSFPWYLVLVACMAVAGIFFRLQANSASANSGDIQLAESTYPNIVGSRIDTCVLCHTSSIPNLNPFGAAYKAQGRGQAASLHAIEGVDSDVDGFTNLQEILALTFPGNPADKPAAATATSTPFQPATSTPTRTSTATVPASTATSTRTQTPTTAAATSTSTRTSTAVVGSASATPSKTATVTSVAPSLVPSSTATARASRTPTAKPTLSSSVVPTCITSKDDDHDGDDRRAKLNCSHRPNKGDSDDKSQNKNESDDQDDASHRSSAADDRLSGLSSFLSSLFARLTGKSN